MGYCDVCADTEAFTRGFLQTVSRGPDDSRIVELRTNVRRAAESQLTNGVIDTTDLLGKLTDENRARLDASYHRIQLLQHIYQLKHTVNQ